jgi:hypothetical protein
VIQPQAVIAAQIILTGRQRRMTCMID